MEKLDQDRIAELVAAAKAGDLPEAPTHEVARRGRHLRTVDFSRPTKFGPEYQRRMARAHDSFCLAATTRLGSELRWPVELEVLGSDQLTWAAMQSRIPPRSVLVVLELVPIGTRLLLAIEEAFLVVGLECRLGGEPARPSRERRLSEIDWALASGLVDAIVSPLSSAWQELGGVSLRVAELGVAEVGEVAAVSEATFGTHMEIRINQQSYSMSLLVPWGAIEPIERVFSGRDADHGAASAARSLREPLAAVPVTLRAEVAHRDMRVRDILRLTVGSVITFEASAQEGVDLYAEQVRVARAQPGRSGRHCAVQLTSFEQDTR